MWGWGNSGNWMVVIRLALSALDADCGCHWMVVAHGIGGGVMMVTAMVNTP